MANTHKSETRALLWGWFALLLLSLCIVQLGSVTGTAYVTVAILCIALIKAAVVIEHYMDMRYAPRLWRCLLHAWAVVLSLVITLIMVF